MSIEALSRLFVVASLGLCSACSGASRPAPALPQSPSASGATDGEASDDRERRWRLARSWARGERASEALDEVADLLVEDPTRFRARVETEPAFAGDGFARLLATGGVSPLAEDDSLHASFDVDGDGVMETFAVSHRATRAERFLAVIARTPRGVLAKRLGEVTVLATRMSAFRTSERGAVVLLESDGGHSAALEIHLVHGVPPETAETRSAQFVLDPGDSEEPPPTDGALCFSVIDVVVGGQPELVLTLVDPMGEPKSTWVLAMDEQGVKDLGSAEPLRRDAAQRLRAANPLPTRAIAEALVRLEPESPAARLDLLRAVDVPTQSEWSGFYPPGTNDFVALHSAFYSRHVTGSARQALAAVPPVASFLERWSLTVERLADESDPLLPPTGLWGRAHFLDGSDVSTAFSYFRLVEEAPDSLRD